MNTQSVYLKGIIGLVTLLFLSITTVFSQTFQKTYGSTQDDRAYSIQQTFEGGYIISGNQGKSSSTQYLHVVKTDNAFNTEWTFRINASSPNQTGRSVIQTLDSGYVIAGNNNGISGSAGSRDYFIVKLDKDGTKEWTRDLDQNGAGNNSLYSIQQLADGSYICSGSTDASCGTADIGLIKLNSDGTYAWKKNVSYCSGSGDSWPARVVIADDGDFVIAGTTNNGSNGGGDVYLAKVSSDGSTVQWGKRVGGSSYKDQGFALTKTLDGGYAVAGYTKSYPTAHAGVGENVYVLKFDSGGTLQWSRTVGGTSSSNTGDNRANAIVQTKADSGFAVAGYTSFYGSGAGYDGYVVKLDKSGTLLWTKTMGGSSTDVFESIIENNNGDLVMAGYSASYGSPASQFDWFMATLDANGNGCGPNMSSGGASGSGGATGTDNTTSTVSISDKGSPGTVSTFTGTATSMFSVSVSPTSDTICYGGSTTLTASGGSGYTWSPSEGLSATTGATVVANPSATTTYTVIGTGTSNCDPKTVTLFINTNPFLNNYTQTPITCRGGDDGTISMSISGGTGPYSYLWNTSPSQTTATITGLSGGIYVVTITDATGCNSMSQIAIQNPIYNAENYYLKKWGAAYNGPANQVDVANAIAIDENGYIYVTGSTKTNSNGTDYLTIKYNSAGSQQWASTYNGSGNSDDDATSIAVNTDGSIYVTGSSTSSGTGKDYATLKYDSGGNLIWASRYNGSANGIDSATTIAVNGSDVFVTGYIVQTSTGKDFATISYAASNGYKQWIQTYGGTSSSSVDAASSLVLDKQGNILVNGRSTGNGGLDMVTIKYQSNGTQSWLQRYSDNLSTARLYEKDPVTVDSVGNVFATGTLGSTTDIAVIKYDSAGTFKWTQTYNGAGSNSDQVLGVATDKNRNVYVTGYATGSGSNKDYITLAYDSSGQELWLQLYNGNGNGNDISNAIVVDSSNNIYITGTSDRNCSGIDFTTVKYLSSGDLAWTQNFNGTGDGMDQSNAIGINLQGDLAVTGNSVGVGTNYDIATIKYFQALPNDPSEISLNLTNDDFAVQYNAGITDTKILHISLVLTDNVDNVISTNLYIDLADTSYRLNVNLPLISKANELISSMSVTQEQAVLIITILRELIDDYESEHEISELINERLQGLFYFSSVFKAIDRYHTDLETNSNAIVEITNYGGSVTRLSPNISKEDIIIDVEDFLSTLQNSLFFGLIGQYDFNYISNKLSGKTTITLKNLEVLIIGFNTNTSVYSKPYNPVVLAPILWGSDCGCCGNYNFICLFAHWACFVHDYLCQTCTPPDFCLSGCVSSSCF